MDLLGTSWIRLRESRSDPRPARDLDGFSRPRTSFAIWQIAQTVGRWRAQQEVDRCGCRCAFTRPVLIIPKAELAPSPWVRARNASVRPSAGRASPCARDSGENNASSRHAFRRGRNLRPAELCVENRRSAKRGFLRPAARGRVFQALSSRGQFIIVFRPAPGLPMGRFTARTATGRMTPTTFRLDIGGPVRSLVVTGQATVTIPQRQL